jgi:hypothetical protein
MNEQQELGITVGMASCRHPPIGKATTRWNDRAGRALPLNAISALSAPLRETKTCAADARASAPQCTFLKFVL